MNTSSRLIAEMKDKKYRDGYVAAQIVLGIPGKIRALRAQRDWTQGDLARLAKMAQPRISEIETPGERKLNIDTLQRIASAFDVALQVDFVPFGELIDRSEGFDPDSFSVKSFDEELAEEAQKPEIQTVELTEFQKTATGVADWIKRLWADPSRLLPLPNTYFLARPHHDIAMGNYLVSTLPQSEETLMPSGKELEEQTVEANNPTAIVLADRDSFTDRKPAQWSAHSRGFVSVGRSALARRSARRQSSRRQPTAKRNLSIAVSR
jgi:transcriptional regulator with XRE-family HTH domain